MPELEVPVLAVVGHPNKGKSSLVATLAQDDSVAISENPGTTIHSRSYPMRVDGRTLYTLVDTPGFQRARQVLAWLEQRARDQAATAADRPALIAQFLEQARRDSSFPDECEVLEPLVAGAGILYVVDGSVPYGPDYEAEMEILRWTGCPSMALINPIGERDHIEEWRTALGQFFRVVRVVDALRADFETQRQLLLAFGELESHWRAPIEEAVAALDLARISLRTSAAREIAELIGKALALVVERRLDPGEDAAPIESELEREYKRQLTALEARHRREVQRLYGHPTLEANTAELDLLETDLFSEGTWLSFGLSRRDLVTVGAIGGATTAGAIDVALGGASLLLGTMAGAVVGGALGWFGARRLAELHVVNRPLGGRLASYGPSRNPNFPFVLFGRARYHHGLLASRTHAMRDILDLTVDLAERLPLDAGQRKLLEVSFSKLRKSSAGTTRQREAIEGLMRIALAILEGDEARSAETK
jgi:hypothetical protein